MPSDVFETIKLWKTSYKKEKMTKHLTSQLKEHWGKDVVHTSESTVLQILDNADVATILRQLVCIY